MSGAYVLMDGGIRDAPPVGTGRKRGGRNAAAHGGGAARRAKLQALIDER